MRRMSPNAAWSMPTISRQPGVRRSRSRPFGRDPGEVPDVECDHDPSLVGRERENLLVLGLAREAVARGICEQISGITVWRWLSEDAIKPWQYRSWIFPRDPDFTVKAGRILDLYAGRWEGELLHPGDYVVCCDEKPSIQARDRKHATLPAKATVKRGQRADTSTNDAARCATSPPITRTLHTCERGVDV